MSIDCSDLSNFCSKQAWVEHRSEMVVTQAALSSWKLTNWHLINKIYKGPKVYTRRTTTYYGQQDDGICELQMISLYYRIKEGYKEKAQLNIVWNLRNGALPACGSAWDGKNSTICVLNQHRWGYYPWQKIDRDAFGGESKHCLSAHTLPGVVRKYNKDFQHR